jgi:PAS domain S-box-containing protein
MNTHFKFIILLISIVINLPVLALQQNIKFQHLSLEDGLSQSTVYAILQDSQGFIWFGTQDGLNKYDGYEFTVYRHDPSDAYSLSHNEIFAIYEDSNGTLWIGTSKGLNRFDRQKNRFIRYLHKNTNSLSHNSIWSIYEDNMGILWIGTDGGGLSQFDRHQNQFLSFKHDPKNPHSLSHNEVWPIFQATKGVLWIGTNGGGLNKFDRQQKKFTHYWPDEKNKKSFSNRISSIYQTAEGNLWIGSIKGLHQFDPQTERFVHYFHDPNNSKSLSHNAVWGINEDERGRLWIVTDGGGINLFEGGTFVHFKHDSQNQSSLSSNAILSLYQDKAGTMWFGTSGSGVNYFNQKQEKFVHYFPEPNNSNSLNNKHILSIYADQKGFLWVGTRGGLNQFDEKREKVTHFRHEPENPNSLSNNEIHALYEDSMGTLWIGTFGGGLNQFNREQNQFVSYKNNPDNPDSLINNYVMSIYEDKMGELWIATRGGLDKFNRKQGKFTHYVHDPKNPNTLGDNNISSIYEDKTGTVWIGTLGGGVNKFDRLRNHFIRYQHDEKNQNSLSYDEVSSIYEDKTGTLWIGTYGCGLNKFDRATETFTHYSEKNGLANSTVYCILEDNQGKLWLSTNRGLSKFNPKTERFRNYDVLDGLQSNEFNPACYKNQRGELFFGGINGFNAFYPEQVKDNSYIPPIVMTDFKMFNQSVGFGGKSPLKQHISLTKNITLSYKQSFFSFEFAALNFLQPKRNQYAYKLEGFDNNWNDIRARRHADYTNVPHGSYIFRVKGSNNDNVWNEQGAALKITILPPPWKTWWAYTLYVLTILTIIVSYHLAQERKLRKQQKELKREKQIAIQLKEADRLKDEFLANTSHELRTPLNGIIGIAESLIDGAAGTLSQKVQSNLAMVVSSGKRLLNLVNDILDFSQLKKKEIDLQIKTIDIRTIAEVVLTHSQGLIGHKKVQLINAISPKLPPINADENRLQQILYNLVGNAIKFTESGTVKISAVESEVERKNEKGEPIHHSQLEITVSDTGIGIHSEQLDRIFEAFEQADGSTARIYGGTGLGLAVTQQLIHLHGGQMRVKSQLGVGSQFSFTLPINYHLSVFSEEISQLSLLGEPLSDSQSVQGLKKPRFFKKRGFSVPEKKPSFSKKRGFSVPEKKPSFLKKRGFSETTDNRFTILIVDDDPVNRQVLINNLSLQNYTISQVASGAEALAYLKKEPKPDIVLLDVMMPQMSGYEVTETIRKTYAADELPIILLTAKNQVADLVMGLKSGANDYLTKPISKNELVARIKTHLHILKLKAEALRVAIKNKKKLKQLLEAMPVGVTVLNADGKPSYTNKRAQQLLGKMPGSLNSLEQIPETYQLYYAGKNELYPSEKLAIVRALRGESSSLDNMEIHRSDKIIPIEVWGTPIFDEKGNITCAMATFQDITERKQAEADKIRLIQECEAKNVALQMNKKIEEKNKALINAMQELQATQQELIESEKMAALGNLVAGVAHEINTPVGVSMTAASYLESTTEEIANLYKRGDMTRSHLKHYLNSAYKSSTLILRNLIRAAELTKSFKQVAVDQASEQERTFILKDYLDEIVKSLQPKFKRSQIQVSIVCDENIELASYPGAFYQIITNLIINSLIHGFQNEPEGEITIEGRIQDKFLILRYSDNGKGITAEIINKIFEPFFTTNRQKGGSGLGLHITYNLVTHKLNGTIRCESVINQGTTFIMQIPCDDISEND